MPRLSEASVQLPIKDEDDPQITKEHNQRNHQPTAWFLTLSYEFGTFGSTIALLALISLVREQTRTNIFCCNGFGPTALYEPVNHPGDL